MIPRSILRYFLLPFLFLGWSGAAFPEGDSQNRFVMDMVFNNLGEPPTESAFNAPKRLSEWGYNGQVPHLYVQCAVTFDSLDKSVAPEGSEMYRWITQQAAIIDRHVEEAEASGIKLYPFTDFLVIPRSLYEKHRKDVEDFSIRRPMVQRIVRSQIEAIFRRFPKLGGLTLRFGETYLHDTPYHLGRSPVRTPQDHTILIDLLREEICVKRNKMLFYRTWDFGDNFHVNPVFYRTATDPVKPHPNLVFSIKHTRGDFFRNLSFNPTIGVGKHRQIIEVQCQREYEGKGAHPNYIAQSVIEGFEEYLVSKHPRPKGLRDVVEHPNFAGVWTWSRGGGWKGPYIENELWCELNAYVLCKWAQNPSRSEEAIFHEYAMKILGLEDESIDQFRELCLLSVQGVIRGRSSVHGDVNVLWTRDEFLGGLKQLGSTFDGLIKADRTEPILAEKAQAVAIWRKIEALAQAIDAPDTAVKSYLISSSTYGRMKYEIIEKGWTVMLLGKLGDPTGNYDKPRINAAIKAYDRLWSEWERFEQSTPSCPTIYRNHYCRYIPKKGMFPASGMQESVDHYRNILNP